MSGDSAGARPAALGIKLSLVYGGFFLFLGMFAPYWPVWLEDSGFGLAEIGILVALTHGLKTVTSPFIGHISDMSGNRRRILFLVGLLSVISFTFYFGARGLVAVAVVTIVSHIFIPAMLPLAEQFTVMAVRRHGVDYGRVRAVGSVTFILASLAGGILLDLFSSDAVIPFCLGALCATLFAIVILPPERSAKAGTGKGAPVLSSLLSLIRDRHFLAVLIMVGLLQSSHGVYYALGSVHWRSEGIDPAMIGTLWGVGVVAEIILFVTAGRWIATLNPKMVFFWIGVLGVVRWAITAFSTDISTLMVVQLLHAATYGATHLATISFLGRHIPEERAASAQALVSAGPMGLGLGLALASSGVLYDHWEGGAYLAMAGLCALCALFAGVLMRPGKDRGAA